MLPPPNFTSCEEVLPYLARNWQQLTMTEFTNACAWGLDPGFVQHDAIVHFIRSLPRIKHNQLPREQDCHICFSPYNTHPFSEVPAVRLRCGHIVGATCLCEWLSSHDYCPQCRTKVCSDPMALPQALPHQRLSNRHAQVLRGLLESGQKFLTEVRSGPTSGQGSVYVEGYEAFRIWAYTPSENLGGNHETIVARIHARAHIGRWVAYNAINDDDDE